jgi:hypothetical protein
LVKWDSEAFQSPTTAQTQTLQARRPDSLDHERLNDKSTKNLVVDFKEKLQRGLVAVQTQFTTVEKSWYGDSSKIDYDNDEKD